MKTKKIQLRDLKVGDKIKTLDPKTYENTFKTVTSIWDTEVPKEDQVTLTFMGGTQLHCSINHPIMTLAEDGVKQTLPNELNESDWVISENAFTKLDARTGDDQPTGYIDITVEDTHTFFAASSPDEEMVLTHNSQGGIRNASATITFPIWHYQFDDMIVLKNNQGTEETRVRHLDYSIAMSAFFWRRFKKQENITFFDPNEVPDMYEAFYRDTEEFERLYLMYEKKSGLRTKTLPAAKVIQHMLIRERSQVGRIYITNVDNVIRHSPFDTKKNPIYLSNLCQEIFIPSQPFESVDDAGELVFSYHGEDLHVPNTAKAQLADGTVKDVRYVDEEDDVLAFRLPSGITITLEGDVE